MSASRLQYGFPLLPRGQTLIIALTRDEAGAYSLFISFDHRVSEGMAVAAFLNELIDRLRSYGVSPDAIATVPADVEPAPACSFCGRSLVEEVGPIGGKGLLTIRDANNQDAYCCSTCWGGW